MQLSDIIGRGTLANIINNNAPAGFMGYYGRGGYQVFGVPGAFNFVVPSGVTRIRVRVVGAGGGAAVAAGSAGSGEIGRAHV